MLATVKFKALTAARVPLTFGLLAGETLLSDSKGVSIPFTAANSSVTIASDTANVSIVPATKSVTVGDKFTVDVVADYLLNSGGYQFTVVYNPALLAVKSFTHGSFLPAPVTKLLDVATPGVINYSQFTLAASGVTGGPADLGVYRVPGVGPRFHGAGSVQASC